ncbi:hypothetical protein [Nonomuraea rosea]
MGLYKEALKSLDAADEHREDLPDEVRPQLLELHYHAELVSATAVGDRGRTQEAIDGLTEIGKNPDKYVREACGVEPTPAPCATPTSSRSESPSSEPETSVTPHPQNSSTEPTDGTTSTGGATDTPESQPDDGPRTTDDGNNVPPDTDGGAPAPTES